MLWWPSLIELMMLPAQATVPPRDRFHYALGGLMNGPTSLELDLTTGAFDLSEADPSHLDKAPVMKHGRLNANALQKIKVTANALTSDHLETPACREASRKGIITMPVMDHLPVMFYSIGDRMVAAPAIAQCWTKSAYNLVGVVLDAVHNSAT